PPAGAVQLGPEEGALVVFTSGTTGEPRGALHAQRYLPGQHAQAKHWLGAQEGELVWCTTATGWSKSARNVFLAPWLCGAVALLHEGRFDPSERLELIEGEWWPTGDVVAQDDDGYLWYQGRRDDLILSSGYRIGPFEVESALLSHPAVAEAAAVAAPDPERGAVVRAIVVLRDGEPSNSL